jgi:hypothetical protein
VIMALFIWLSVVPAPEWGASRQGRCGPGSVSSQSRCWGCPLWPVMHLATIRGWVVTASRIRGSIRQGAIRCPS